MNMNRKNWVKENIISLLTLMMTGLIAFMTIRSSQNLKRDEINYQEKVLQNQRHSADSLNSIELKYKRSQLLRDFMPFLISDNPKSAKIAFLGFYSIDPKFALNTAKMINNQGAIEAISSIWDNKSGAAKMNAEHQVRNNTSNAATIALDNALQELVESTKPNFDANEHIQKYRTAAKATSHDQWSVPFVVWCYKKNQIRPLSFTGADLVDFYNEVKTKNLLIERSQRPSPGDIALFDFREKKGPEQLGIVSNTDETFVYTIEADNNGEAVSKHIRYKDDVMYYVKIK